jgi:sulfofructose kinase
MNPKTVLFDGHQPNISIELAKDAEKMGIPVILDAGSVSDGTQILLPFTDYLVASEAYAREFTSQENLHSALNILNEYVNTVVITMGAAGVLWKNKYEQGKMDAVKIKAIDTTGAGDTFHGVFALGVAKGKKLIENLNCASVAAALCCTKFGARSGIPHRVNVEDYISTL